MRRKLLLSMLGCLLTGLIICTGCASAPAPDVSKFTEQDVRNAVTELINGINNGDLAVVQKYVGAAGPAAEEIIAKLKGNIKLSNIRDVSIRGTNAQATVTLDVVPLNVSRDITLNFNATDILLLNSPLGLLSIFL